MSILKYSCVFSNATCVLLLMRGVCRAITAFGLLRVLTLGKPKYTLLGLRDGYLIEFCRRRDEVENQHEADTDNHEGEQST